MPIFRVGAKIVYFAHVPKCGGTSVEHYLATRFGKLAFLDNTFYELPQADQWNRTSPQHISAKHLQRLFPDGFFDETFAVVRHPVARLVSEFHYLRDVLFSLPRRTFFSDWLAGIKAEQGEKSWTFDNHLRPMSAIVPQGARVFRLEDGLDKLIGYFDVLAGAEAGPRAMPRLLESDKIEPKVSPSRDDLRLIQEIYSEDFRRFGYEPLDFSLVIDVRAAVPDALPHYDMDGEAALQNGTELFTAGRYGASKKSFRDAIDLLPSDPRPRALVANVALRKNEAGMALYHALVVLRDHPDHADALVALAGVALRQKNFDLLADVIGRLDQLPGMTGFAHLLKLARSIEDDAFEVTLYELAEHLQTAPDDVLAEELFFQAFQRFRDTDFTGRFDAFIESLGLDLPSALTFITPTQEAVSPACVDVIIPVHNALSDLQNCLRSLRGHPSKALKRVVLVDDFSGPETASWLDGYALDHEDVILVRKAENVGFTRAVTAGIEVSAAPFFVLLNSDTILTEGWLDGLLSAMAARPRVAIVGPLSNEAFCQTIQPMAAPDAPAAFNPLVGNPTLAAALVRNVSQRVFPAFPFLSGFCVLARREAFDAVGGLDCRAFPYGYWEVQDLALRLIDAGWLPIVADTVYVHHFGGSSIKNSRRMALSNDGRKAICGIHSALRVHVALALSRFSPVIAQHKQAWREFDEQPRARWS